MLILKGIIIGIVMMVPGLSGGSMAMVLNVYTQSVNCISNINIKNIFYLVKLLLGGIIGILFFSFCLYNITTLPYFTYIVKGIIILNILLLIKQYKQIKFYYFILIVIGYLTMMILNNFNSYTIQLNLLSYLIIGLLLAISLILPGLGASYVLYILNLYNVFNEAIITFNLAFLINISIFTLLGIFLSAKLIDTILNKDKHVIYSLVIGLLVASI